MRRKIAVLCGGYSGEAAVSFMSAKMVMDHMDSEKYEAIKIVITSDSWFADLPEGQSPIDKNDFSFLQNGIKIRPEACFIIIHGTPGEDGKVQGYLDMLGIPYTSGGVMNTSITFNKIFTTRILHKAGFNVARGILIENCGDLDEHEVAESLKFPMFVKPNEGGSSLGVSKVKTIKEIKPAVELAFSKGTSVLIEEFLEGREFSCGVISTKDGPQALHITEISTKKEFFDYAAKYEYDQTQEITPAQIEKHLYEKCQMISEQVYKLFHCRGVARIDYKMKGEEFFVIEVNTVPGMTEKSLVPQQAEAMGITKKDLISLMLAPCFA